jgi:hypothetical protein
MKPISWITSGAIAVAFAVLLVPSLGAQDLPKAETILDKYLEARGGKEAHDKVKSRVSTLAIEIPAAGLKGKATVYQIEPNKVYSEAEFPGIGKIEEGTDGQIVWEKSALSGARIKQGEERASFFRHHAMDADANWRKYYKSVETKGVEKVEGKDCYKVEQTPHEGQVETHYYDKATGLLVKSVMKVKTAMGELPVEAVVVDYKKVDGLVVPATARNKVAFNEMVVTVEKVEHNVKVPEDRFKLPEDVQKLVDQEKKGGK